MNVLYALVLIFSPNADAWTEERYANNLSFEQCDSAQRAVWAMESEIVGYDDEGRAIPSIDAYCVTMDDAPVQIIANFYAE